MAGWSDSDAVKVVVDGLYFDIHISCSDKFLDGYGQKGGPAKGINPPVVSYHITKVNNPGSHWCSVQKECSFSK